MTQAIARIDLVAIEKLMLQYEQEDVPACNIFSGGICIRQISVPKDTVVVGKRHRFETCNILLKGSMEFYCEETNTVETIDAPFQFTSKPFTKKLALFTQDSIFMNLFPTNLTNWEEVEKQFIITEEEFGNLKEGVICQSSEAQSG